jgi:hypothetical protein
VWFRLVADDPNVPPKIRRGLAQVELARGAFDVVDDLLETGPGADPFDLAIAAMAAAYRRDHAGVSELASAALVALSDSSIEHNSRSVASLIVGVGQSFAEVGEGERAMRAAERVRELTAGAPPDDPLVIEGVTLEAAAHRLAGDRERARATLDEVWDHLDVDSCDRGLAERESARRLRDEGNEPAAQSAYTRAVSTFRAAGERWLADSTEQEAAATP